MLRHRRLQKRRGPSERWNADFADKLIPVVTGHEQRRTRRIETERGAAVFKAGVGLSSRVDSRGDAERALVDEVRRLDARQRGLRLQSAGSQSEANGAGQSASAELGVQNRACARVGRNGCAVRGNSVPCR